MSGVINVGRIRKVPTRRGRLSVRSEITTVSIEKLGITELRNVSKIIEWAPHFALFLGVGLHGGA